MSNGFKSYSWQEINNLTKQEGKRYIIIQNGVYNVSTWQKKHPGGARIIGHFIGQDATEAWRAMHNDLGKVEKYMKHLKIGEIQNKIDEIEKNEELQVTMDFIKLRKKFTEMGLFKTKPYFFFLHMAHIILLEIVAWSLFSINQTWPIWLLSAILLATAQAQAGWTQHDYGHLSVFNNFKLNHLFHQITIGHLKGASSHWWNFRHFQHHVKPNVFKKDPDITLPNFFLLGENLPNEWGKKKRGKAPYQHQHNYFWLLGPWFLLPGYFHLENIYFIITRRDWYDFIWMASFFVKLFYLGNIFLGGFWATFKFYMFIRWLESHWFVFVTQMSHLPMEIDNDNNNHWVKSQTIATCNIESSTFNDWFSGHLNFQIEHHLFPTMPRHNYKIAAPYVEKFCKKHNLTYTVKPLYTAFSDIIRSLKKSGNIWYKAYYHAD